MITRTQLLNKLRELGYTFSRKAKRVEVYRRPTDYHRVMISPGKQFSEAEIGITLTQCGCTKDEILRFIRDC